MPYVNNPRYGMEGEPRLIFEHERSKEPVDPGMARFIVAVIGLALVPWLYPLLTAVLVAVGAGAAAVAREGMGLRGAAYALAITLPVLLVLALVMRIEQRLGTLALYRWTRHAVRVLIPAALLYVVMSGDGGRPDPTIASWFHDLRTNSSIRGGTIFVAVLAQVILWFSRWLRDDWHASLVKMRMRASGLG